MGVYTRNPIFGVGDQILTEPFQYYRPPNSVEADEIFPFFSISIFEWFQEFCLTPPFNILDSSIT